MRDPAVVNRGERLMLLFFITLVLGGIGVLVRHLWRMATGVKTATKAKRRKRRVKVAS